MSVPRYIEGLIFSLLSQNAFRRIKKNPLRSDINPYCGFEMMYAIMSGVRTFGRVREVRTAGMSLGEIAMATYDVGHGYLIPPEILLKLNKKSADNKNSEETKNA